LNRPVTVGSVSVALLPHPTIQVDDVRVDNLSGFDGPAFAFVERLRLDVAALPLLVGRVRVRRLALEGPRLNLAVDAGGTSNYGDLAPDWSASPGAPSSPVRLAFRQIVVSNAAVSYLDATTSRSFTVSGVDLDAALGADDESSGWRAEIVTQSDSLHVRVASLTEEILRVSGPTAVLTLKGDATGRGMDVTNGSVELAGHSLTLHGRIAGLDGAHPSYDLQLSNQALDADVFSEAFPARQRSELMPHFDGVLGVTLQVTQPRASGGGPVLRGSVRLDDVAVHLAGNLVADDVRGTIGIAPDTVAFDSLAGVFARGPFAASGFVSRAERTMSLTASLQPNLDEIDRLGLLPRQTTVSGDARVDLSLSGRLDALDSLVVAGTVALTGAQVKLARLGVPLYVPTGAVTFVDREAAWSDLTVLLGEDRLVTTGRVARATSAPDSDDRAVPRFDISIRGARLDLGALLPAHEDAVASGYPLVAISHLGGRSIGGQDAATVVAGWGMSRPERVPATGDLALELDTLRFRDRLIESLVATVNVSDTTIVVEAPELRIWGGAGSATLVLGVGPAPEEPFSLTLRAGDAIAGEVMAALTPAGDGVSGRMSLDAAIQGGTDRSLLPVRRELSGRIVLTAADGHMRETGPNHAIADFLGSDEWIDFPYAVWDTRIDVDEEGFEVRSSNLSGPMGQVALAGVVRFDGSHDLAVGISIPPEYLDRVSLQRTGIGQGVLEHLRASGSSLDLGLRMSGVLWAPSVEPDASSALASAR
jgi:hypothetical protein